MNVALSSMALNQYLGFVHADLHGGNCLIKSDPDCSNIQIKYFDFDLSSIRLDFKTIRSSTKKRHESLGFNDGTLTKAEYNTPEEPDDPINRIYSWSVSYKNIDVHNHAINRTIYDLLGGSNNKTINNQILFIFVFI